MLGRSGRTVVLLTRRSRSWRCFAGGVRQGRRALVEEQPEERKKAAGLLLLSSLAEDRGKRGEDLLAVNQRWATGGACCCWCLVGLLLTEGGICWSLLAQPEMAVEWQRTPVVGAHREEEKESIL